MIATFLLGVANVCAPFNCDAYVICTYGEKPPLNICLQTANACLQRLLAEGEDPDNAWEICAELIPPWMINE